VTQLTYEEIIAFLSNRFQEGCCQIHRENWSDHIQEFAQRVGAGASNNDLLTWLLKRISSFLHLFKWVIIMEQEKSKYNFTLNRNCSIFSVVSVIITYHFLKIYYGGIMSFNGSLIKTKAKEAGYTLLRLAQELGVSRQTVNGWISGVTPRGSALMRLCSILNMKPGNFFAEPAESLISVPLHRTIRKKPVSDAMRETSLEMAKEYLNLFRQAPTVDMTTVVRVQQRSEENAAFIAKKLRVLSKVVDDKPMDYESAFQLLTELGVYTVFRAFPANLSKDTYAFYSRIAGHRVVFVNIDTSVIDLIFFLLHETVHAVRDEVPDQINIQDEEDFCDLVTQRAQFPARYVEDVALMIQDLQPGMIVNRLKEISRRNHHAVYGICKQLEEKGVLSIDLQNLYGASVNLSKEFPTLRSILLGSDNVQDFLDRVYTLSPKFMELIEQQIPECSVRKFGEWLGLDTSMDAQAVMDEMLRRKAKRQGINN
jgi:transcriptional regulator with XRE-family HTH domain